MREFLLNLKEFVGVLADEVVVPLVRLGVYCPDKCRFGFRVPAGKVHLCTVTLPGNREHRVEITAWACRKCRKHISTGPREIKLPAVDQPITVSGFTYLTN